MVLRCFRFVHFLLNILRCAAVHWKVYSTHNRRQMFLCRWSRHRKPTLHSFIKKNFSALFHFVFLEFSMMMTMPAFIIIIFFFLCASLPVFTLTFNWVLADVIVSSYYGFYGSLIWMLVAVKGVSSLINWLHEVLVLMILNEMLRVKFSNLLRVKSEN